MKPKIPLRISSVLMLLHAIGHTFGIYSWNAPSTDIQHQEVINQMVGDKFSFMGATGSFGKFYEGFGYACTLAMLLMVIILWIISGVTANTNAICRKISMSLFAILVLWGIVEIVYFFPFAAFFTIFSAIFIFISLLQLRIQK